MVNDSSYKSLTSSMSLNQLSAVMLQPDKKRLSHSFHHITWLIADGKLPFRLFYCICVQVVSVNHTSINKSKNFYFNLNRKSEKPKLLLVMIIKQFSLMSAENND